MPQFVVDASVALAWFFKDEETEFSERLFAMTDTHELLVPPHWFSEVANGMRIGEVRKRCTAEEAGLFVKKLEQMRFAIDRLQPFSQFELILPLARTHNLTVYDAIYLHIASSSGAPLATFDKELADAARSVGVDVVAA